MKELRKRWDKVYKSLLKDRTNEGLMDNLIAIESSMVRRDLWSKGIYKPSKGEILSTHEKIKKTLPI